MTGGVADRMDVGPRSWRGWLKGWRLWLWWVLANTVGFAVGGSVGTAVGLGLSSGPMVRGYVAVTVAGIAAGVLQWLVLRRQVARAGWWAVTGPVGAAVITVVGLVVGFAVGVVGGAAKGLDAGLTVGVIVFGTVLGVLQWRLVLRRQVARAGWWVLASTVGYVVGGFLSGGAPQAERGPEAVGWALLGFGLVGAVYGAITGRVLAWLLHQRTTAAGESAAADGTNI